MKIEIGDRCWMKISQKIEKGVEAPQRHGKKWLRLQKKKSRASVKFVRGEVLDESPTSANLRNDHEFIIKEYIYIVWDLPEKSKVKNQNI